MTVMEAIGTRKPHWRDFFPPKVSLNMTVTEEIGVMVTCPDLFGDETKVFRLVTKLNPNSVEHWAERIEGLFDAYANNVKGLLGQ